MNSSRHRLGFGAKDSRGASHGVSQATCPPGHVAPEVATVFEALLATGMGFLEALEEILDLVPAGALTWEAIEKAWLDWVGTRIDGHNLSLALNRMSFRHPALARRAIEALPPGFTILNDLLLPRGVVGRRNDADGTVPICRDLRWIQGLPQNLRIEGSLIAMRTSLLHKLPDGLWIGGWLSIWECPAFTGFGTGLHVGESVGVRECPRWDGRFPADTVIRGRIRVDDRPMKGLTLAEYRRVSPCPADATP